MKEYQLKPAKKMAYQFNPGLIPFYDWNMLEMFGVRPTSYLEINKLLGTSGCSKEEPFFDWSVMGIVTTIHGQETVVVPGDYIVLGADGIHYYPVKKEIFEANVLIQDYSFNDATEALARRFYDKYCEGVGGKAFNGDALPSSSEFFSDPSKEKQANAYRSGMKGIADLLLEVTQNLGHPGYVQSTSTTVYIDNLRNEAFDFMGIPESK